ncbi:MAG: J domain-containing protein [Phycisphaerae bacterium]|nr:J domain-containing protein [Phycisphaerae bacterium]
MPETYYVILGVAEDATVDHIKSAYRQKALELHPDHHGDDAGPFLAVQEAYAVLSNPERRRAYDRSLQTAELRASRPEPKPVRVGHRHPHPPAVVPVEPVDIGEVSLSRSFETFSPSFEAIFDRLWSNFAGRSRPKDELPKSLTIDVPIAIEDAEIGGFARVMVPAVAACPTCEGHGGVGPFECWRCSGSGSVTGEFPVQVEFPAGMTSAHVATVPLDHLGITNTYLVVRFRVV